MNIVKILTQLQSVPLKAVDVTAHPAVLGFALTHGRKKRCPLLFSDGVCLGSHDELLQLYQSGALARQIAGQLPPTTPYFPVELPIALY
ncbi:Glutaredoxin-related protein, related [Eimeria acervulina]|uniref:Glutaredoxin-related protein, related n=1 Tax=Eimeria acervulina TaxID=5801 RepID=U6GL80_EIMAC|nr:Glutaredoxin-related protein, related [Eimeria acervulina]CDI80986.1 Glutaredoxin-related protein, related [Eimeria acervulina]